MFCFLVQMEISEGGCRFLWAVRRLGAYVPPPSCLLRLSHGHKNSSSKWAVKTQWCHATADLCEMFQWKCAACRGLVSVRRSRIALRMSSKQTAQLLHSTLGSHPVLPKDLLSDGFILNHHSSCSPGPRAGDWRPCVSTSCVLHDGSTAVLEHQDRNNSSQDKRDPWEKTLGLICCVTSSVSHTTLVFQHATLV